MPLPREQVFNELNGLEVKRLLEDRVAALLSTVPYLQRHLTLPRVRMTVTVELVVRADQEGGERHRIADDYVVRTDAADSADAPFDIRLAGQSVVNAAPGQADSKTPGEIRYEAGLPDAVPVRGPVATEDAYAVAGDVPVVIDKSYGRLPTEQEKIAAHRQQQAERAAGMSYRQACDFLTAAGRDTAGRDERATIDAAVALRREQDGLRRQVESGSIGMVELPGIKIKRGVDAYGNESNETFVRVDRGGPAIGGTRTKPVTEPVLHNAGATPDASARDEFRETRETGVSKGNRRDS